MCPDWCWFWLQVVQQNRHLQLEKHCYDSLKNWLRQVQKDCGNIKKLLSIGAEQKVKQSKTKSIKKHHGGNEKVWTLHFFPFGSQPPAKCCATSRPVYQFASQISGVVSKWCKPLLIVISMPVTMKNIFSAKVMYNVMNI